ncbi:MAG: UDP-N-acetylmuramoyl-L-alanyl-D-glutamate--2,6-diaminopimelate ligase [Fibrobacter sp.]|nr:UDP-N-acetylmuramoyl-L-alanyl-D-glutamate--2,6-diaminopimelate ligase [Fibrobacter sp.]
MVLSELVDKSGIAVVCRNGDENQIVTDICYDSRKVIPGAVYVAVPGTKVHGDAFIKDAVARGAIGVITENPQTDLTVPWIQIRNTRNALGVLGKVLWGINDSKMTLVGVTGTNGKTTVTHLFKELLLQKIDKKAVWMFGTINYHTGEKIQVASHTTPEALDIFRYIGNSDSCPEGLVMEVSSHSLALDRIGGMTYDCAVWTNLTQDHLDFHQNMENYYQSKKRLFTEYLKPQGCRVINIDDPWGKRLLGEIGGEKCITYGLAEDATVRILSYTCDWDGCTVEVLSPGGRDTFKSRLRGFFNVYNMCALIAGGYSLGMTSSEITGAFNSIKTVPGRMDRVEIDAPYSVIVDYAHTPDALLNILKTSQSLTRGRLLCVFGCGGDRDKTKRPVMAGVVAENCDEAIITSDNPRSEKPQKIIDDILEGIPLDFPYRVVVDRREAIKTALSMARKDDCIVIAGKGHEDYQEIQGVRHHFNDKEVVVELYNQMEKL